MAIGEAVVYEPPMDASEDFKRGFRQAVRDSPLAGALSLCLGCRQPLKDRLLAKLGYCTQCLNTVVAEERDALSKALESVIHQLEEKLDAMYPTTEPVPIAAWYEYMADHPEWLDGEE